MIPSNQRLKAANMLGLEINDRLVKDLELVSFDSHS